MSRKEDILNTALKLFNETNTQASTTNHIAKAMGISPGNLHYHYKNREEIIRILYVNMRKEMVLEVDELPKNIQNIIDHEEYLIQIRLKYKFFFKELILLFSKDSELETLYINDNIEHRKRIRLSMKNLIDNKELNIKDDRTLDFLTDTILLSWQFYTSYAYTLGKCTNESIAKEALEFTHNAIHTYITAKV